MKRITALLLLFSLLLLSLTACGTAAKTQPTETPAGKSLAGLEYESSMELQYADQFSVDYYKGGYKYITVGDSQHYLVVPENGSAPENLDKDITVIQQPLDTIYLAATSAMALFDSLDALDTIRLVGTQESGWYIDNAVAAMQAGDMVYAGKYSEPDYELMVDSGCDLAIESTMILHSPDVQEMIEKLGIPVFVERSSYEAHPLGRTEWIKLYGALLNKEEAADAFFREQAAVLDELADFPNTEKTVAFFYVTSTGTVCVHCSDGYVAKMIELAGGRYFSDAYADEESVKSTMNISMEEFYAAAVNADYLIYNAAIDAPLQSVDDLLAKNKLFGQFKAVQNGNVWCTGKYLFQATDIVGKLITDINHMLTGKNDDMTFLYHLD